MPEVGLVYANKFHDHEGEDVRDRLMDIMSSNTITVSVSVPHLGGVSVGPLNHLGSKLFTIKFNAFVCMISIV